MQMSAVATLPGWAAQILEEDGMGFEGAAATLREALERPLSALLRQAADACAGELERRAALRAERRILEQVQCTLNASMGRAAESETVTDPEPDVSIPWPFDELPSRQELLLAAALVRVRTLEDLRAAMELNSLRASVHYDNYELAHDNQVIGFHNAALRARAQGTDRR